MREKWDGRKGEWKRGLMAERMNVTEGLGSAMLSIWLRDVLCSCTVVQRMDIGITQHTYRVVLTLAVRQGVLESIKALKFNQTAPNYTHYISPFNMLDFFHQDP